MDRGGGQHASAYLATAALAALVLSALAVLALLVVKPLGTAAAFVIGAFVIAERHELSASMRVHPWWLAALGALIAAAVPVIAIAG